MTRIAVVGGHGQVARLLHPLLIADGHEPVALVRREEQAAALHEQGVSSRHLDIEADDEEAFAAAFEGCEAVVFAAGGGPDGDVDRKRTVDLEGALKSIAGAQRAGIRRFVQVSAIGVDEPLPDDTAPVWRAYVEAKRDADAALRESDLDWTILRPGRLLDDGRPGTSGSATASSPATSPAPTSPPWWPRWSAAATGCGGSGTWSAATSPSPRPSPPPEPSSVAP